MSGSRRLGPDSGLTRAIVAAGLLLLVGCAGRSSTSNLVPPGERLPDGMELTSPAFDEGRSIPERFSCEGDNVPPPLRWTAPPPGATEVAVVVEDTDAPRGRFVHWIVVGIPPATRALEPEGLPPGAEQLPGSSDNPTYIGPCPPGGEGAHTYFFQVYALRARPDLSGGPEAKVRAIRRAATAGGGLAGTFQR